MGLEKVTNPSRTNQFTAFFTRIPQTGTYASNGILKKANLDFLNASVKEFTTPGLNFSELRIPYRGYLDTKLPGDTIDIDPVNVIFELDKDIEIWKSLTNWGLIQHNIMEGGARNENFTERGVTGEIAFQWLDVS